MEASHSLNNTQIEILSMFSSNLTDEELLDLKRVFTRFLAAKIKADTEAVWDEKGWTNDDMKILAKEHLRVSRKKA